MTIPVNSAHVYTDFQGLDKLKYGADNDSPETLRLVAEQFEAIFLQMMLKSARPEDGSDGLFDSEQTDFYQDWHDKQLAINLATGKGIGIADMLVKQLQMQGATDKVDAQPMSSYSLDSVTRQHPRLQKSAVHPAGLINAETQPVSATATHSPALNTPDEFAQVLLPHAQAASERLGVAPQVLLAQAALETGWGKKISKHATGESSHNLFNIKADGRWNGKTVSVPTLEYRDGVAVREVARFRAYDSYAESFEDYVSFIQNSSRYQPALAVADDAQSYTQELSAAGYATDPEYANKIMNITNGKPLQDALESIKI